MKTFKIAGFSRVEATEEHVAMFAPPQNNISRQSKTLPLNTNPKLKIALRPTSFTNLAIHHMITTGLLPLLAIFLASLHTTN